MGNPSDTSPDRVRSQALAERSFSSNAGNKSATIFPPSQNSTPTNEAGGLSHKQNGRGSPSGSPSSEPRNGDGTGSGAGGGGGAVGSYFDGTEKSTRNDAADSTTEAAPPPAPPPNKSEDARTGDTAIASTDNPGKPAITTRMLAGSKRFVVHMRNALFHSWVNVLLVFVPIGIAAEAAGLNAGIVFGMNAIAIIPLAGLLSFATEAVAARLGDTLGALLNVSFGNAVELIIFIIALVKNEIQIVQASLLGSILANLLLILGMAFLFGGLRYREQVYNSTVTQMSACLLSLSVMSLLLPTAFYQSFRETAAELANKQVLKVSRGTSVVLLLIYILYLLFQLKSHAYMYESTPQEVIDEESHPGVLADMMNSSSSSSDDSSTTDDSDSDTSGSGSIAYAGKKIKRVFKNRRQRKSSTSASSVTGSGKNSALSSPSISNENERSYWEAQGGNVSEARHESRLGAIASGDEADADNEDTSNGPRVRDFVAPNAKVGESSKSPERKKHRKKHKKHQKKRQQEVKANDMTDAAAVQASVMGGDTVQSPIMEEPKAVGFADDVQFADHPSHGTLAATKSPFNMRGISSRASLSRPGLPKMLSNNVFVKPAPQPSQSPRPTRRSQSGGGSRLRRTSSLPDRLNRPFSETPARTQPMTTVVSRTDPLPPFQHQRSGLLHKVRSGEAEGNDEEEDDKPLMSRTAAVVLLLCTTALVAVCAEFMVDAIPAMIAGNSGVSQAFIGLIILPIVGNAAEHVTAVTVAAKNKMDLAIGVAVGSSIQIALFVTPVVVLLGWILDSDMSLYFNIFETISLFVTVFVVNFLVLDGRSNYLEGSLLIAAYVIIALSAFFYPSRDNQSAVGSVGGGSD